MGFPSGYRERLELMDAARLARTLSRMAHEMVERHPDIASAVLVGVRTRGVPLAQRLARLIKAAAGAAPPVGALDVRTPASPKSMRSAKARLRAPRLTSADTTVPTRTSRLRNSSTVAKGAEWYIDYGLSSGIEGRPGRNSSPLGVTARLS